MPSATERQVWDWLRDLGKLVAANMAPAEAGERLRAYVPELVARFDSADFDAHSREFVARNCNFFPSYGQVCELLDKWRDRPRPVEKSEPPPDSHLTTEDWQWVSFWHKRRAELFAQDTGFKRGSRDADLANLASLIRSQSAAAWAHISGSSIPVQRAPTEAEIAYVARLLRPPAVAKSAPLTTEQARAGITPRPVDPETLRAMREARGVRLPEPPAA